MYAKEPSRADRGRRAPRPSNTGRDRFGGGGFGEGKGAAAPAAAEPKRTESAGGSQM